MILWDWEPSVVIGCAALAIGYLAIIGKRGFNRAPYFLAGVALLLLDLVSPIDTLADSSSVQRARAAAFHFLALVVPPLFLLGIPAIDLRGLGKLERSIGQPPVSWLLGVGAMLAWHIPVLFNAALANDGLHVFQHLSFLITGVIFWWPDPHSAPRSPLAGTPRHILFVQCLPLLQPAGRVSDLRPRRALPRVSEPSGPQPFRT